MKNTNLTGLAACIALALSSMACSADGHNRRALSAGAGCSSIGDTTATLGAFYNPGNAYSAKQEKKRVHLARAAQLERTTGATVFVHAQPGLTGEYLERALTCHAVNGKPMNPNDPLHPESGAIASLSVNPASSGYAVRVIGESTQVGREIWSRSQAFTSSSGSVEAEQLSNAASSTTRF